MECAKIAKLDVSRFILGGNPFSGFSHQTPEADLRMKRWFTAARIKELLFEAERLGINTVISRADHHIMRVLLEYWDSGGTLQWLAQTCPELGSAEQSVPSARAASLIGAVAPSRIAAMEAPALRARRPWPPARPR